MKIAVEGCAHGALEIIYDTIKFLEEKEGIQIDLLICCGDFQASRNKGDLECMAVPVHHRRMGSFYKYYNGEKQAPILTIFIGGNHEASNYMQELPYGGWVAPNIYYLGYGGVINIAGVRIGGISGISKGKDYFKGHYEVPPYSEDTKRSVYHTRNLEVFRLKQVSGPMDVFMSHDWPCGIWHHGDVAALLEKKPFLGDDIESGQLGSKPCNDLLEHLQPRYYFAAHLHCKFAALVEHPGKKLTRFLALDKCLPNRKFLQITEVPHNPDLKIEISYDLEWLTILRLTNGLLSVKQSNNYIPGSNTNSRKEFTPSKEENAATLAQFSNNLVVPNNFVQTAPGYDTQDDKKTDFRRPRPRPNPQTTLFCKTLGVEDPLVLLEAFESCEEDDLPSVDEELQEKSDVFESFLKNSPPKLLSLSLPEPKFNQSESLVDESGESSKSIRSCEEDASTLSNGEVNIGVVPEDGTCSDLKMADTSPSGPKKFRRRNADIYCAETT